MEQGRQKILCKILCIVGRVTTAADIREDRWAVVDPGPLRSEMFVPVEGAYVTEGGDMFIPYAMEQVKQAPKAGRDHVLDARTEVQLEDHYELR